jgi:cell division protein FtsI (penicillin-binding protein 3)
MDGFTIRDEHDYGDISVTTILTKSSNVGASKLALSLNAHDLPRFFGHFGFGRDVNINFPGTSGGSLPLRTYWSNAERAALAYGYGLSVTALQLAHAYAALANGGVMVPLSLLRESSMPEGTRVVSAKVSKELVRMLETVVTREGTASRAQVPGYLVAGKTGTAHKTNGSGYASDQYVGVFAGMAPVPDPRYVTVVMINAPQGQAYYGGLVAAPVFSDVMASVLRIMQVDPQHPDQRYADVRISEGQS